ncbi:class I SAM-dependent methyltransferase [Magnetospirillum sp. SS-4]|uniref:class I SAM-dependent methyltransferase n=1 Tax=Magnetospirillum sp. SS-4 TaxID=2681465 RepID=UPI0015739527|nr:class I SAM-dependent methyltransferase [Magnetospirillum sp. SS-4]
MAAAGEIPGAVEAFHKAILILLDAAMFPQAKRLIDEARSSGVDHPAFDDYKEAVDSAPVFFGFQGTHAPERQVYMSAAVHMLGTAGRPISILEIGTYMGASMITWARAIERFSGGIGEIYCLDPWDGADSAQYDDHMAEDIQSGLAYRVFQNATRFVGDGIKVTELRGFSDDILPTLAGMTFDIIYVDGCHLHPEVLNDLRSADALLSIGGFMCGDDLEVQLHELDRELVEANARNDFVLVDGGGGLGFHPGVTLGVGTFFGPVSAFGGFWIMRKTAEGYRPVQMRGKGLLPYHWPQEFVEQARRAVVDAGLLHEIL